MGGCISRHQVAPSGNAEQIQVEAAMRRLGMNHYATMHVLKEQVESIDPRAPMRVMSFDAFRDHGKLPRSNDGLTMLLSEVVRGAKIVFISHRWLSPFHNLKMYLEWYEVASEEDRAFADEHGLKEYYTNGGRAHPDDAKGSKHKLICSGVVKMAADKRWDLSKVYIWLDFAGIDQDNNELKAAGVASLRGYVCLCDAVIIPAPSAPKEGATTVDQVPGGYGERAWTLLEALVKFFKSVLKREDLPELWVVAGEEASYMRRMEFVLDPEKLPSRGVLFDENDRADIKMHEDKIVEELKAAIDRRGYITMHTDKVRCVVFHPTNPDMIASCSKDREVRLVNRGTGTVKASWKPHSGRTVWCVAFSPDGGALASGGEDGSVRVWDVRGPAPTEKCCFTGHSCNDVWTVSWSEKGNLLASGGWDKTVRVWDVTGSTPTEKCCLRGHSGEVMSVAFQKGSNLLASAGSVDCTVRVWDVMGSTPTEKHCLTGDVGGMCAVAWSGIGNLLAGGSRDGTIKVWDVTDPTPTEKWCFTGHSCNDVWTVSWSEKGNLLASGGSDKTVRVWDVTGPTPTEKCCLTGHTGKVRSVAFHKGSDLLVTGSADRTVRVWDVTGPTPTEKSSGVTGHSSHVTRLAFNKDCTLLASWGRLDDTLKVWDVKGPTPTEKYCLTHYCLLGGRAQCVDAGPEIRALAEQLEQAPPYSAKSRAGSFIVKVEHESNTVCLYEVMMPMTTNDDDDDT